MGLTFYPPRYILPVMRKSEALKAWRRDAKLSQEAAARLAGCSLSGWRSWETERAKGPSTDILMALERYHPGLILRLADPTPNEEPV